MFDWDRFKNGEIAAHCDNEGKANDFLEECDKQGIKWLRGDKSTHHTNYEAYYNSTCYNARKGRLTYGDINYFKSKGIEIIKWENKMEKTFREVIANIKEGEVWESNEKTITMKNDRIVFQVKEGRERIVNGSEKMMFSLDKKYKLQRKEYTFQEAFKAYEEGKEIESCFSGQKFRIYSWEDIFNAKEIREKWYINE